MDEIKARLVALFLLFAILDEHANIWWQLFCLDGQEVGAKNARTWI